MFLEMVEQKGRKHNEEASARALGCGKSDLVVSEGGALTFIFMLDGRLDWKCQLSL